MKKTYKLSPVKIAKIVFEYYHDKKKQIEIAKEYNISHTTVSHHARKYRKYYYLSISKCIEKYRKDTEKIKQCTIRELFDIISYLHGKKLKKRKRKTNV